MAKVRHLGLFPWCFDPALAYFKGEELRTIAVPIWWQVKKWQATVAITYPRGDNPPETISETFELDVTALPYTSVASEIDLVCLEQDHGWSVSPSQPFEHSIAFSIGPLFDVTLETDGETDTISTFALPEGVVAGSVELFFSSITKTLPMYGTGAQGQTAQVTLTATDYWPYA